MSHSGGSTKVVVLALFANLGIALAKFVGFFFSQSASMLAEAIHSLVDCTNQGLLLWGAKAAARPPDEKHPLGYGRAAFFWSFIVAILLFSLGGVFAIYEGVHKLGETGEMRAPWVGIGVLVVAIVLEGFSFVACIKEVNKVRGDTPLWNWFRDTTSADLLVIFTEDAAALAGLVIALICMLLSWATGQLFYDALGSILVGVVLVVVAVLLAVEIKSMLIGESASTDLKPQIQKIVSAEMVGASVIRLIALQTGSDELMLSMKIDPGSASSVDELIAAINRLEKKIKSEIPSVRWLFVEPDREA